MAQEQTEEINLLVNLLDEVSNHPSLKLILWNPEGVDDIGMIDTGSDNYRPEIIGDLVSLVDQTIQALRRMTLLGGRPVHHALEPLKEQGFRFYDMAESPGLQLAYADIAERVGMAVAADNFILAYS